MIPSIAAAIEREGSISFARYHELALYGPDGFFTSGSRPAGAGRRADFITSPEVGPLFGEVLSRALDAWWVDLGRPDPFVVIEAGAGNGTLAKSVLSAAPECSRALRYVLVERSPVLRREQERRLTLTEPALSFAGVDEDDDEPPPPGPIVTALAELPAGRFDGVVLANELLDDLPVRVAEWTADGWAEVRVTLVEGRLGELLVPLDDETVRRLGRVVPGTGGAGGSAPLREGARVPVVDEARRWLRSAAEILVRGRVVVFDYGDTTAELGRRGGWLRTYHGHDRGDDPYAAPGECDITCDVAFDQLDVLGAPAADTTQAAFLRRHGIDELVEEGRRVWNERAGVGDLAAVKARSRVSEAEALLDERGLGAFRVLSWVL